MMSMRMIQTVEPEADEPVLPDYSAAGELRRLPDGVPLFDNCEDVDYCIVEDMDYREPILATDGTQVGWYDPATDTEYF